MLFGGGGHVGCQEIALNPSLLILTTLRNGDTTSHKQTPDIFLPGVRILPVPVFEILSSAIDYPIAAVGGSIYQQMITEKIIMTFYSRYTRFMKNCK